MIIPKSPFKKENYYDIEKSEQTSVAETDYTDDWRSSELFERSNGPKSSTSKTETFALSKTNGHQSPMENSFATFDSSAQLYEKAVRIHNIRPRLVYVQESLKNEKIRNHRNQLVQPLLSNTKTPNCSSLLNIPEEPPTRQLNCQRPNIDYFEGDYDDGEFGSDLEIGNVKRRALFLLLDFEACPMLTDTMTSIVCQENICSTSDTTTEDFECAQAVVASASYISPDCKVIKKFYLSNIV